MYHSVTKYGINIRTQIVASKSFIYVKTRSTIKSKCNRQLVVSRVAHPIPKFTNLASIQAILPNNHKYMSNRVQQL